MEEPGTNEYDARTSAAAEMLGRVGAKSFELRFSEPEEGMGPESPVVWMAIGFFEGAPPQVSAGLHPVAALEKLLEQLIDGGECQHCHKMTSFHSEIGEGMGPFASLVCAYQYDPELKTYRRSCEGA